MAYKEIRTLRADEIECRVGQIDKDGKGLSLLLYKDARCDMNILDETFGPLNWQRHHNRDNANCIISVWDPDKSQWIEKEDTGTESNTESAKGLASDACKRSCVNWGIGRELYTAPFIWVSADKCSIVNGRCFDKFDVSVIEYDENRRISTLVIINEKTGEVVFQFRKGAQSAKKHPQKKAQSKPSLNNSLNRSSTEKAVTNSWQPLFPFAIQYSYEYIIPGILTLSRPSPGILRSPSRIA